MKNKREEKRAQKAEVRIKQAQEYDGSFPNGEFAQMINEFQVPFHRPYCRAMTHAILIKSQ